MLLLPHGWLGPSSLLQPVRTCARYIHVRITIAEEAFRLFVRSLLFFRKKPSASPLEAFRFSEEAFRFAADLRRKRSQQGRI